MAKSQKRKKIPKKTLPRSNPKGSEIKNKIPLVKAKKQRKMKCSICLDSSGCRKMKYLPCQHRFHLKCVNQWLENHHECPLCRSPIDKRKINEPQPSTSGITREDRFFGAVVGTPNVIDVYFFIYR